MFSFARAPGIDEGVRTFRETPGAVLLDVRNPDEYGEGHIPGSVNLPLPLLDLQCARLGGADTPIFVYCLSGMRSRQAANLLRRKGYTRAKSIGGISDYTGAVEF